MDTGIKRMDVCETSIKHAANLTTHVVQCGLPEGRWSFCKLGTQALSCLLPTEHILLLLGLNSFSEWNI